MQILLQMLDYGKGRLITRGQDPACIMSAGKRMAIVIATHGANDSGILLRSLQMNI